MSPRLIRILALVAALAAVSVVGAAPKSKLKTIEIAGEAGQVLSTGGTARNLTGGSQQTQVGGRIGSAGPSLACAAGRNGGATDVGVTGNSIKLGATVVETGNGKAFLSDVRHAMNAVVNRVNASGGICGRRIQLVLRDDGWDANLGFTFIQNLVKQENVFALAVVPSSEGLRAASQWLLDNRVPVVGTDGMLGHQYSNPVIWPVAAATTTAMHVMAKEAFDRGARRFGIVYDSNYRFGVEGAFAFNAAVRRLTRNDVPGYSNPLAGTAQCRDGSRFCGIKAGKESYGTEVEVFNRACQQPPECDFVAYLLEPQTALQWMRDGGRGTDRTTYGIGGPQPLFNRSFAAQCGRPCHRMWVWTGFTPPIEPFSREPAVTAYVNAVRQTNASADVSNSFVEGGYLGMKLLVDALQRTGPRLTRRALMAALDSTDLDPGLSRPLSWRRGKHFANRCVMAFEIESRPSFAGWRQQTGWLCDPWLGRDVAG